jgi:hypothetical protein
MFLKNCVYAKKQPFSKTILVFFQVKAPPAGVSKQNLIFGPPFKNARRVFNDSFAYLTIFKYI